MLRNKKSKCPSVGNWLQKFIAHTRKYSAKIMFLYLLARKDGPIVELHSKAAIYSIEKEKWGERKRETD